MILEVPPPSGRGPRPSAIHPGRREVERTSRSVPILGLPDGGSTQVRRTRRRCRHPGSWLRSARRSRPRPATILAVGFGRRDARRRVWPPSWQLASVGAAGTWRGVMPRTLAWHSGEPCLRHNRPIPCNRGFVRRGNSGSLNAGVEFVRRGNSGSFGGCAVVLGPSAITGMDVRDPDCQ
jgi:hypothetical protein